MHYHYCFFPMFSENALVIYFRFHVLLVADEQNCITVYAYGVFPLLSVPCNFYQPVSIYFPISCKFIFSTFCGNIVQLFV